VGPVYPPKQALTPRRAAAAAIKTSHDRSNKPGSPSKGSTAAAALLMKTNKMSPRHNTRNSNSGNRTDNTSLQTSVASHNATVDTACELSSNKTKGIQATDQTLAKIVESPATGTENPGDSHLDSNKEQQNNVHLCKNVQDSALVVLNNKEALEPQDTSRTAKTTSATTTKESPREVVAKTVSSVKLTKMKENPPHERSHEDETRPKSNFKMTSPTKEFIKKKAFKTRVTVERVPAEKEDHAMRSSAPSRKQSTSNNGDSYKKNSLDVLLHMASTGNFDGFVEEATNPKNNFDPPREPLLARKMESMDDELQSLESLESDYELEDDVSNANPDILSKISAFIDKVEQKNKKTMEEVNEVNHGMDGDSTMELASYSDIEVLTSLFGAPPMQSSKSKQNSTTPTTPKKKQLLAPIDHKSSEAPSEDLPNLCSSQSKNGEKQPNKDSSGHEVAGPGDDSVIKRKPLEPTSVKAFDVAQAIEMPHSNRKQRKSDPPVNAIDPRNSDRRKEDPPEETELVPVDEGDESILVDEAVEVETQQLKEVDVDEVSKSVEPKIRKQPKPEETLVYPRAGRIPSWSENAPIRVREICVLPPIVDLTNVVDSEELSSSINTTKLDSPTELLLQESSTDDICEKRKPETNEIKPKAIINNPLGRGVQEPLPVDSQSKGNTKEIVDGQGRDIIDFRIAEFEKMLYEKNPKKLSLNKIITTDAEDGHGAGFEMQRALSILSPKATHEVDSDLEQASVLENCEQITLHEDQVCKLQPPGDYSGSSDADAGGESDSDSESESEVAFAENGNEIEIELDHNSSLLERAHLVHLLECRTEDDSDPIQSVCSRNVHDDKRVNDNSFIQLTLDNVKHMVENSGDDTELDGVSKDRIEHLEQLNRRVSSFSDPIDETSQMLPLMPVQQIEHESQEQLSQNINYIFKASKQPPMFDGSCHACQPYNPFLQNQKRENEGMKRKRTEQNSQKEGVTSGSEVSSWMDALENIFAGRPVKSSFNSTIAPTEPSKTQNARDRSSEITAPEESNHKNILYMSSSEDESQDDEDKPAITGLATTSIEKTEYINVVEATLKPAPDLVELSAAESTSPSGNHSSSNPVIETVVGQAAETAELSLGVVEPATEKKKQPRPNPIVGTVVQKVSEADETAIQAEALSHSMLDAIELSEPSNTLVDPEFNSQDKTPSNLAKQVTASSVDTEGEVLEKTESDYESAREEQIQLAHVNKFELHSTVGRVPPLDQSQNESVEDAKNDQPLALTTPEDRLSEYTVGDIESTVSVAPPDDVVSVASTTLSSQPEQDDSKADGEEDDEDDEEDNTNNQLPRKEPQCLDDETFSPTTKAPTEFISPNGESEGTFAADFAVLDSDDETDSDEPVNAWEASDGYLVQEDSLSTLPWEEKSIIPTRFSDEPPNVHDANLLEQEKSLDGHHVLDEDPAETVAVPLPEKGPVWGEDPMPEEDTESDNEDSTPKEGSALDPAVVLDVIADLTAAEAETIIKAAVKSTTKTAQSSKKPNTPEKESELGPNDNDAGAEIRWNQDEKTPRMHENKRFDFIENVDESENINAYLTRMTTLKKGGHLPGLNTKAIKSYEEQVIGEEDDDCVEVDIDVGFVKRALAPSPTDEQNSWDDNIHATRYMPIEELSERDGQQDLNTSIDHTRSSSNQRSSSSRTSSRSSFVPTFKAGVAESAQPPIIVKSSSSSLGAILDQEEDFDNDPAPLGMVKFPHPSSTESYESMNDDWMRKTDLATRNAQHPSKSWLTRTTSEISNKLRFAVVETPKSINGVEAAKKLAMRRSRVYGGNRRSFIPSTNAWKLSYKERTKDHPGYFNVDFCSLMDSAAVGPLQSHRMDDKPWESRDTRQNFLHDRSIGLSKNWFGKSALFPAPVI